MKWAQERGGVRALTALLGGVLMLTTLSCTPQAKSPSTDEPPVRAGSRHLETRAVSTLGDLRYCAQHAVALALAPVSPPGAAPASWSKIPPWRFFSSIQWKTYGTYAIASDSIRSLYVKTRGGTVYSIDVVFIDSPERPTAGVELLHGTLMLSSQAHPILRELAGAKGFSPFSEARALPSKQN